MPIKRIIVEIKPRSFWSRIKVKLRLKLIDEFCSLIWWHRAHSRHTVPAPDVAREPTHLTHHALDRYIDRHSHINDRKIDTVVAPDVVREPTHLTHHALDRRYIDRHSLLKSTSCLSHPDFDF